MSAQKEWVKRNHDAAKDLLGHKGAFETCPYPMCALAREDDLAGECALEGRELQVAVIEQARAERDALFPAVVEKLRRLLTVVNAIRSLEDTWDFERTTLDRNVRNDISAMARRLQYYGKLEVRARGRRSPDGDGLTDDKGRLGDSMLATNSQLSAGDSFTTSHRAGRTRSSGADRTQPRNVDERAIAGSEPADAHQLNTEGQ